MNWLVLLLLNPMLTQTAMGPKRKARNEKDKASERKEKKDKDNINNALRSNTLANTDLKKAVEELRAELKSIRESGAGDVRMEDDGRLVPTRTHTYPRAHTDTQNTEQ